MAESRGMGPHVTCEHLPGGDPGNAGAQEGLSGGVLNSNYTRSKNSLQITFLKFYMMVNFGPQL